jgi:hypothetical protein
MIAARKVAGKVFIGEALEQCAEGKSMRKDGKVLRLIEAEVAGRGGLDRGRQK